MSTWTCDSLSYPAPLAVDVPCGARRKSRAPLLIQINQITESPSLTFT